MTTIRRTIALNARAEHAWSAVSDFAAVHRRLAPGLVVDARMDTPTSRIVTFFDGRIAREVLVSCDDAERRLVYTVVGGRLTHHNASAQIVADGDDRCRFVWITTCFPTSSRRRSKLMARGAEVMKETIETSA